MSRVSREVAPTGLDAALIAPLSLRLGEADVALLAELLVGKNRGERFQQAPSSSSSSSSSSSPSPTLRLAVARVLSVGCLRFLLHSGGARPRTVLRGGRRQRGRLWDAALNDGFSATFSALPMNTLWNLATVVLPLAERRQETLQRSVLTELTREERRALGRALPKPMAVPSPRSATTPATATTTALDHVFCVLALEHRNSLRLPDTIEEPVRRALISCSPLAALFFADEAAGEGDRPADRPASRTVDDDEDAAIDALCQPGLVRLLECCDDALAEALVRRLRALWTRSADARDFEGRCARFARRVQALLRGLERARRLDLIGPVARFVAALPDELPRDARARLVRLPGVTTMVERDRVVGALQAVVDVALALDDVRARMQAERYGDDRYEEGQLALHVLDATLKPRRDAVASFARGLSGAVG